MGEVYGGRHTEQGVPVAVKVMTGAKARDEGFVATFRNEVRAVASLHHPGIVLVFDYGEVGQDAEEGTDGKLVAGSPYLAMELASEGSLEELIDPKGPPLGWERIRHILVSVLDALAHAHARGIVHRDLKPANVLVCGDVDARPGLKLTDFGLAHALDDTPSTPSGQVFSGTPNYMSPEQIQCQWRDYGPWTDLYAVGCLAFELASMRRAFTGEGLPGVLNAHLSAQPSAFIPRSPVPEGFARWIHRLYQRDPRQRYQCAADAMWALNQLGDVLPPPTSPDMPAQPGGPDTQVAPHPPAHVVFDDGDQTLVHGDQEDAIGTLILPDAFTTQETVMGDEGGASVDAASALDAGSATLFGEMPATRIDVSPFQVETPPVPHSWRRTEGPGPSMRLMGAGLGLYGLREIPLVDREPERELLWAAMKRVAEQRRSTAVVLQGPVGCGKSRLAEWLGQRAAEVGAATVLKAVHAPVPEPADGLRGMLARRLRSHGLSRDETRDRAEMLLRSMGSEDHEEWLAAAEVIHPTSMTSMNSGGPQIRFGSPKERYIAVQRFMARLSGPRPTVAWFDDAQWGIDSLGFVLHMLEAQGPDEHPVLMLITAQDEALAERPGEKERLDQILAHDDTRVVPVDALAQEHRPALVRALLGLEAELAEQVEARTEGNPLFAVQLVGDWVQRGVLELGDEGFRLRSGAKALLPDDVDQVWRQRIDRVLEQRPDSEGEALELAAVLGQQVDEDEWRAVCEIAGVPHPTTLGDSLVELRLARAAPDGRLSGWSFVHGLLRESLLRRARENGRWDSHNRACARMLDGRSGPGLNERLAGHLLASGEWEQSLRPLLDGARERMTEGAYTAAEELLAKRTDTMHKALINKDDSLWGEAWVARAGLERQRVQLEDAVVWADRALTASEEHGWAGVRAEALLERGVLARLTGDADKATRLLGEAEEWSEVIGEARLVADCVREQGDAFLRQGEWEAAQLRFIRAEREYTALGDDEGSGKCLRGLAGVARQAGRFEEARPHLEKALEHFQQCGSRWGVAVCANDLGELARLTGDLPTAAARYREALDRYTSVGSGNAVFPEINLGIVLVEEGRHNEARDVLLKALETVEAQGRRPLMGAIHAFLLPCCAGLGDWPDWARHVEAASDLLAESEFVDVDIATALERAGDLASEADWVDGARHAYDVALNQWSALGRDDRVEAVKGKVSRLLG